MRGNTTESVKGHTNKSLTNYTSSVIRTGQDTHCDTFGESCVVEYGTRTIVFIKAGRFVQCCADFVVSSDAAKQSMASTSRCYKRLSLPTEPPEVNWYLRFIPFSPLPSTLWSILTMIHDSSTSISSFAVACLTFLLPSDVTCARCRSTWLVYCGSVQLNCYWTPLWYISTSMEQVSLHSGIEGEHAIVSVLSPWVMQYMTSSYRIVWQPFATRHGQKMKRAPCSTWWGD